MLPCHDENSIGKRTTKPGLSTVLEQLIDFYRKSKLRSIANLQVKE